MTETTAGNNGPVTRARAQATSDAYSAKRLPSEPTVLKGLNLQSGAQGFCAAGSRSFADSEANHIKNRLGPGVGNTAEGFT